MFDYVDNLFMKFWLNHIPKYKRFADTIYELKPPTWTTKNKIRFTNDVADVLDFNYERLFVNWSKAPILIVPPQAGHSSHIADFDKGQSLVQTCILNCDNPIYCIEWKSATQITKNTSIEDLLDCIKFFEHDIHIIGLCQGGWLSTIYTALFDNVVTLTIAGAPIDFIIGGSAITTLSENISMPVYEQIVKSNNGIMSGKMMLLGWKNMNFFDRYFLDYVNIWNSVDDTLKLRKIKKFREWYEHPMDIAGKWYLWCIRNLFKDNLLIKNRLKIYDKYVNLNNITIPINIVVGEGDKITLPIQSYALKDYVGSTDITEYKISKVGHIGVFMSSKAQTVWAEVFKTL